MRALALKIDYDPRLFKEIANFSINEIVQVQNRRGRRSTIHITNITKLSWHELQLLIADGSNKFSKMVLLYKQFSKGVPVAEVSQKRVALSPAETTEVNRYVAIFKEEGFSKHMQVNDYITKNGLWDEFKTIRSLNDHGKYTEIEGI